MEGWVSLSHSVRSDGKLSQREVAVWERNRRHGTMIPSAMTER